MLKKIKKAFKNPKLAILYVINFKIFEILSDKIYLKLKYKLLMNKKLNLINPKTFNEKLQWLKLHDRNPLYTNLVDKYEVRKYIAKTIGEEYLIPLIGVWDKFDEIDFSKLPNQFVLKCTHDSGGLVICTDKSELDIKAARKKINKSLKRNYYYHAREWPYKNVKPRIICEKLIKTNNNQLPNDYKFHCFNGEPDNVMVCIERSSGNPKFFFFNNQWNLLKYNIASVNVSQNFTISRPKNISKMFKIANKLATGLHFVRVDLYCEEGKIYFGEFTFFPEAGFDSNLLETIDILFGEKIKLEEIKRLS